MSTALASRLFLCLFASVVANVTFILLSLAPTDPELARSPGPGVPEQEETTIGETPGVATSIRELP